jgi:hypothetical protein
MSQEIRYFIPTPPPAADIFATYRVTHQFYREAQHRQELERYSEWYRQTAERHQREFQKMQGDINIFGWFSRRKN